MDNAASSKRVLIPRPSEVRLLGAEAGQRLCLLIEAPHAPCLVE